MPGPVGFDGRVAVITGAGGGLGRAHALDLASRGASVVVNDLGGSKDGTGADGSAADRVVDEIVRAGGAAVASQDNIATPDGGAALIETAVRAFGRVDVVINNAGILRDRSFAKVDWNDLDAVLAVHVKGPFYVSQPAFVLMKEQGYGRFVFTASNAMFGSFGQSAYATAKAGLLGLSATLAIEGARSGIVSNVVLPVARTRMTEEILGDLASRLDPETVTPMVTYLSSEACTSTGHAYSAAGGRYARVFTGLASGWYAGSGAEPQAEDIAQHIDEIASPHDFIVPTSAGQEIEQLSSVLGS